MPIVNSPSGTSLGNVSTVTGTPSAGQGIIASSGTAAAWGNLPGTQLSYNEITGNVSITATSEATATTLITATAITFDGSTAALIQFYSPSISTPASAQCVVVLYQDGSSLGFMDARAATAGGALDTSFSCFRRITPASGSRTYSIRAYRVTSNCTLQAGAGNTAGVYQPAFVRITIA